MLLSGFLKSIFSAIRKKSFAVNMFPNRSGLLVMMRQQNSTSDPVYPFNQREMLWTTQKISMYFHSGCYATFAAMTQPYLQKKSSEYGVIRVYDA
jgi:hypothetical protein